MTSNEVQIRNIKVTVQDIACAGCGEEMTEGWIVPKGDGHLVIGGSQNRIVCDRCAKEKR